MPDPIIHVCDTRAIIDYLRHITASTAAYNQAAINIPQSLVDYFGPGQQHVDLPAWLNGASPVLPSLDEIISYLSDFDNGTRDYGSDSTQTPHFFDDSDLE